MKPDYFVHSRTRTFVATIKGKGDKPDTHKKVEKVSGEHVMSYRVFQTLKFKDVINLIGPLAKDKK